jgi:hypothetical protein
VDRLLIVVVLVVGAVVVAWFIEQRRSASPISVKLGRIPTRVMPSDCALGPDPAIIVFTEASCRSCAGAIEMVRGQAGCGLPVAVVEYGATKELHAHYEIDTVPTTVVVSGDGTVVGGWAGSLDEVQVAEAAQTALGED